VKSATGKALADKDFKDHMMEWLKIVREKVEQAFMTTAFIKTFNHEQYG
jgi:hypothetical protein